MISYKIVMLDLFEKSIIAFRKEEFYGLPNLDISYIVDVFIRWLLFWKENNEFISVKEQEPKNNILEIGRAHV